MTAHRVLVCGGRDLNDWKLVKDALNRVDKEKQITLIIQGGAAGADALATEWAVRAAVPRLSFPADWKTYGKRAGPIRNQQMLDEGEPNLVVAFPGGRGTEDMVRRAIKAGIPVRRIEK